ncbi:hypothetical protein [Streptomyces sp. CAU 1734]|uniref:hypothetical protein n=1 Tax=Streptomyces sp. CAU 1734 TaxID=3140360 RepID=UPI0032612CD3
MSHRSQHATRAPARAGRSNNAYRRAIADALSPRARARAAEAAGLLLTRLTAVPGVR